MCKRVALAAFGLLLSVGLAEAEGLGVPVEEVATRLSRISSEMELGLTVSPGTCTKSAQAVCNFKIAGLPGIATGPDVDQMAIEVTVIYGPEIDPTDAFLAWGTLISLFSPDLVAKERGQVILGLMERAPREQSPGVTRAGVRYSLLATEGLGLWFVASSKGD